MISVLFLKFVGRVKNKKIPYFGDGFWEISHILNVQCWQLDWMRYVTFFVALIGFSAIQLRAERIWKTTVYPAPRIEPCQWRSFVHLSGCCNGAI